MTLAGTRPILQDELQKYELHHRARIAIKPGITGMWQVSGRSDITDFRESFSLKNKFINHIYEFDERGIIDKLYELYSDYFQKEYEKTADLSESKSRILNRYLEYNNIELEIIHGCEE